MPLELLTRVHPHNYLVILLVAHLRFLIAEHLL
jgi:hypothetical protein